MTSTTTGGGGGTNLTVSMTGSTTTGLSTRTGLGGSTMTGLGCSITTGLCCSTITGLGASTTHSTTGAVKTGHSSLGTGLSTIGVRIGLSTLSTTGAPGLMAPTV